MEAYVNKVSRQKLDDILRPEAPFDWAEEVEEMLNPNQVYENTSTSSSSTLSDDESLLRPDNFRWDEEEWEIIEEELTSTSTSSPVIVDGCCSLPNRPESPLGFCEETQDCVDECTSEAATISHFSDSSSQYSTEPGLLDKETRKDIMQTDVDREFAFRDYCLKMAQDEGADTHHFNWMGCPAFGYSATPPAVSLMFMLTAPKVPQSHRDELRLRTILKQAMVYIDPVLVLLENAPADLLKTGHDLIRWSTGRVYKFYSLHGSWTDDDREVAEETVIDLGDVDLYTHNEVAHGNGFVQLSDIRCRYKWEQDRNERYETFLSGRPTRRKTHRTDHRVFKRSPLRQMLLMEEEDAPDANIELLPVVSQEGFHMLIHVDSDAETQEKRVTVEIPKKINYEATGTLSKCASVFCFSSRDDMCSVEDLQARVHAWYPYLKHTFEMHDTEAKMEIFEPKLDAIDESSSEEEIEELVFEDIDDVDVALISDPSSYTLPLITNRTSKCIDLDTASTIQEDSESSLYRGVNLAKCTPARHGKRNRFLEIVKGPFRFITKTREARKLKRRLSSTSADWIRSGSPEADYEANFTIDDMEFRPTLPESPFEKEYFSFPKPDIDVSDELDENSALPTYDKKSPDNCSCPNDEDKHQNKKGAKWAGLKLYLGRLCAVSPSSILPFRG